MELKLETTSAVGLAMIVVRETSGTIVCCYWSRFVVQVESVISLPLFAGLFNMVLLGLCLPGKMALKWVVAKICFKII